MEVFGVIGMGGRWELKQKDIMAQLSTVLVVFVRRYRVSYYIKHSPYMIVAVIII